MVRAILDGQKSQTRRVVREIKQPGDTRYAMSLPPDEAYLLADNKTWRFDARGGVSRYDVPCPYGQPCDRLWVRETWRLSPDACEAWPEDEKPCRGFIDYRADGSSLERHAPDFAAIERLTIGRDPEWDWDSPPHSWRSSIHMPRWASRITLEITGIRVERLQEISADDAIAEGIHLNLDEAGNTPWPSVAIAKYRELWDSINARRGHSWESNPWVWVIEFRETERIDAEIARLEASEIDPRFQNAMPQAFRVMDGVQVGGV